MYLAELVYSWEKNDGSIVANTKPFWGLILETKEDVFTYFEMRQPVEGKQVWRFLGNREVFDYTDGIIKGLANPIGRLLNAYVNSQEEGRQIKITEICAQVDKINISKMHCMLNGIDKGEEIRVNPGGGYSYLKGTFTVVKKVECDEYIARAYLYNQTDRIEKLINHLNKKTFQLSCVGFTANITIPVIHKVASKSLAVYCDIILNNIVLDSHVVLGTQTIQENIHKALNIYLNNIIEKYFKIEKKYQVEASFEIKNFIIITNPA